MARSSIYRRRLGACIGMCTYLDCTARLWRALPPPCSEGVLKKLLEPDHVQRSDNQSTATALQWYLRSWRGGQTLISTILPGRLTSMNALGMVIPFRTPYK